MYLRSPSGRQDVPFADLLIAEFEFSCWTKWLGMTGCAFRFGVFLATDVVVERSRNAQMVFIRGGFLQIIVNIILGVFLGTDGFYDYWSLGCFDEIWGG